MVTKQDFQCLNRLCTFNFVSNKLLNFYTCNKMLDFEFV